MHVFVYICSFACNDSVPENKSCLEPGKYENWICLASFII